MTMAEKAMGYAQRHLQAVRICWIDRRTELYDAVAAVELCSDPRTAGRIMGVVAQDAKFQNVLERLIDDD